MSWITIIEQAALSLGFDLIDTERTPAGLLRVTIDWPWAPGVEAKWITAEDCERLTRQLRYSLEVENLDYKRLEVSSPGIDRPLRHEADFTRFEGDVVDINLKEALGQVGQNAAGVAVNVGRKKFRGHLRKGSATGQWRLECREPPFGTPAPKGKKKVIVQTYELGFSMDEIKDARLAPLVNFKGRAQQPDGLAGEEFEAD